MFATDLHITVSLAEELDALLESLDFRLSSLAHQYDRNLARAWDEAVESLVRQGVLQMSEGEWEMLQRRLLMPYWHGIPVAPSPAGEVQEVDGVLYAPDLWAALHYIEKNYAFPEVYSLQKPEREPSRPIERYQSGQGWETWDALLDFCLPDGTVLAVCLEYQSPEF